MVTLQEAIDVVRARIETYKGTGFNEQQTKISLLVPILRALGWDTEDPKEVQLEYKPPSSNWLVDYALFIMGKPRLFIEAKALGQISADRNWANQIMGYAGVAGMEWIVLTDGDTYRIYNSHASVPIEQKLFREVRVSEPSDQLIETLFLLSNENVKSGAMDGLWQVDYVDRRVRSTLQELFAPDPDPAFVGFIAERIRNMPEDDIRASFVRTRVRLDFPTDGESPAPLPPSTSPNTGERRELSSRRRTKTSHRISLYDLIRDGLIQPPMELHKKYFGADFVARIESDGTVSFRGEKYDDVSPAAGAAVATVRHLSRRKTDSANGWTFWEFRDSDGRDRLITVLRERYQQRHGR